MWTPSGTVSTPCAGAFTTDWAALLDAMSVKAEQFRQPTLASPALPAG
jgi:hypothetical protein